MIFTPAYLITEYTEEEKLQLKIVGALWSLGHHGYFITEDQKKQMEMSKSMQGLVLEEADPFHESAASPVVQQPGKVFRTESHSPLRVSPTKTYKKKDEGVKIIDDVTKWSLVGNTFAIKDQIKEMGGRWDAGRKVWWFPKEKVSKEELMSKFN